MNDRQNLEHLDRRGAHAALDARARAAARPRPAFDPDQARTLPAPARLSDHRRPRRPFVAIVAAAAVVVGLIAVGVVQHRADDGDSRPAGVTTVQPRPFVAADLPKGLVLAGASGADESGDQVGPISVYGSAPDDPTLGVMVMHANAKAFADWPRVTVDGRTVITDDSGGFGRNVAVSVRGDRSIVVTSPRFSVADLAKLVDEVTIDESRPVVPESALPDGVRLLGQDADFAADSGMLGASLGGLKEGFATLYQRDAQVKGGTNISVASTPGDEVRLNTVRLWSTELKTTSVRGHAAVFTSRGLAGSDGLGLLTLSWLERSGEVLRVSGFGANEAELRTVAEGVRPVPADEWDKLLEQTQLGDLGEPKPGQIILGRGRFPSGTTWALRVIVDPADGSDGDPALDLQVSANDRSGGVSVGSNVGYGSAEGRGSTRTPQVLPQTLTTTRGKQRFAAGLLRDDVTRVSLVDESGESLGNAEMIRANGRVAWVAELHRRPVSVVAFDASGSELARHPLEDGADSSSGPATTIPGN